MPSIISLANFFKLLSDETRLRILVLLCNDDLCVCELCEVMELPQPKISQQLAKLRDNGLVKDERRGQWVFYHLQIEDEVLRSTFESIGRNIDLYPVLLQDAARLQEIPRGSELCK